MICKNTDFTKLDVGCAVTPEYQRELRLREYKSDPYRAEQFERMKWIVKVAEWDARIVDGKYDSKLKPEYQKAYDKLKKELDEYDLDKYADVLQWNGINGELE